ncbi:MAG: HNH endonuclease signature motif containing protein [Candidatus Methylomirabilales bacterium]
MTGVCIHCQEHLSREARVLLDGSLLCAKCAETLESKYHQFITALVEERTFEGDSFQSGVTLSLLLGLVAFAVSHFLFGSFWISIPVAVLSTGAHRFHALQVRSRREELREAARKRCGEMERLIEGVRHILDRWYTSPPDWEWRRRRVMERERFRCVECGQPGSLVHHKRSLAEGGDHSLSNLRLLCRPCHERQTKPVEPRRDFSYEHVPGNVQRIFIADASHPFKKLRRGPSSVKGGTCTRCKGKIAGGSFYFAAEQTGDGHRSRARGGTVRLCANCVKQLGWQAAPPRGGRASPALTKGGDKRPGAPKRRKGRSGRSGKRGTR